MTRKESILAALATGNPLAKETLLAEAVCDGDIESVELLLLHGADPNIRPDDEPILYTLQYPEDHIPSSGDRIRLEIAELLLKAGADPLVEWDDELLLDDVCFEVFNYDTGYTLFYQKRFLLLLILYGATSSYCNVQRFCKFDLKTRRSIRCIYFKIQTVCCLAKFATLPVSYARAYKNKRGLFHPAEQTSLLCMQHYRATEIRDTHVKTVLLPNSYAC